MTETLFRRLFITILLFTVIAGCGKTNVRKGEICLHIGDYKNAIIFYKKALEQDPGSFRVRRGLAAAWLQRSSAMEMENCITVKDWRTTAKCFEYTIELKRSREIEKQLAYVYYRLAKSLDKSRDTTGALRSAMKAVRLEPQNTQMLNYAAILNYRTGKTKTAYNLLLQSSVVDSTDATALFNLGMLHWYSHELLQAHQWWLKALAVDPKNETIQYWFARADSKLRKGSGK